MARDIEALTANRASLDSLFNRVLLSFEMLWRAKYFRSITLDSLFLNRQQNNGVLLEWLFENLHHKTPRNRYIYKQE
jgi:hypothetical protein